MVTKLTDIAQRANVSLSTVSRVINNSKYVSPEIKKKIEAIIKETGYSPNHIARSLVTKKTRLFGVIIPDVSHRFYSILLSGIDEVTSRFDYNVIICDISDNVTKEYNYLNMLKAMNADGIIVMHEKFTSAIEEFFKTSRIPYVLSSVKARNLDAYSITIDDFSASYEAVSYLAELGHKKIALICGDIGDITTGQNRYQGYRKSLIDHGLEYYDKMFKVANFEISDGYRAMEEILDSGMQPTAVFIVSDEMAMGAINCIKDKGLSVPGDISVIGFDDIDLASYIRPKLTTVHQPIKEIGMKSAEVLINILSGKIPESKEMIVEHSLIIRDSCRKVE